MITAFINQEEKWEADYEYIYRRISKFKAS